MVWQLVLFLLHINFISAAQDQFSEELHIHQAPSGHIKTFFKFTTKWEQDVRDSNSWSHFSLFPRSLGEIVAKYGLQELRVSLTQGLWRYEKYGYSMRGAPPGAAVLARFLPNLKPEEVDDSWAGLNQALAGLLCASLNTLDKTQYIEPQYTWFQPESLTGEGLSDNSSYVRYGVLPKEYPCTENLTPWKKLLPCKSRRGLASLLNSAHFQKLTIFQSMALDIRPVCRDPDCTSLSTELSQSLNLVFDPVILNKQTEDVNWSIKTLFGLGIGPPCPLASLSILYVDITDGKFELTPAPQKNVSYGVGGNQARLLGVYHIKDLSHDSTIQNVVARHHKNHIYGIVPIPPLLASRHVTGTGQQKGAVITTIKNSALTKVNVVYLDLIPWYLRVFLHTLKVESGGKQLKPVTLTYVPGRDRERPYHLEMVVSLPPRCETVISVEFEYCVLRWTEYPPDANHGFYVGSAVVTARLPRHRLENATILSRDDSSLSYLFWANPEVDPVVNIFTEVLLVSLPTPDFSMPYNVICLACTVAALAFGPLHNITTKILMAVAPGDGILTKASNSVKNKVNAMKQKLGLGQPKTEDKKKASENSTEERRHSEEPSDHRKKKKGE